MKAPMTPDKISDIDHFGQLDKDEIANIVDELDLIFANDFSDDLDWDTDDDEAEL